MKRVAVVVVAAVTALSACNRTAPLSRARVTIKSPAAAAAVVAVEAALASLPGQRGLRSVVCGRSGVVDVNAGSAAGADLAAAVQKALGPLPLKVAGGEVFPDVRALPDEVVVFAVRGADPFVARDFVDDELAGPLSKVEGVVAVKVLGGRQQRQVRVDLERMLARDVSLPELAAAAGGGASLETTVIRDPDAVKDAAPSMMKMALPPPGPNAIRLIDVATVGLASAGEPLRRDGAVEVRVLGAPGSRAAVIKAALAVIRPAGVDVAALDEDSIEGAGVVVVGASAEQLQQVQLALLSVPGVRLADAPVRVRVVVDEARARQLSVHPDDVERVASIAAGDGLVLMRNTENVVLRLDRAITGELVGQLVVARTAAGPVRVLDVARIELDPGRSDRVDGKPAQRLHVVFDVGVRKNALAALDQRLRALSGVQAVIERDDVGAGLCP